MAPARGVGPTVLFCSAGRLPVEVVHGVTGVAGDLVETLSSAHCLLNGILVIQNLIVWQKVKRGRWLESWYDQLGTTVSLSTDYQATFHGDVDSRGQKQAPKAIVEDLVALQRGCGVVSDFNTWFKKKKKKKKEISTTRKQTKISSTCAHNDVILKTSWPAAKPSKMRFLRSIGWLLVLINTPAWAFRKMSFSSSRPAEKKSPNYKNTAANQQPGNRSEDVLIK